mmetsp:Transcript_12430/g.26803  ORF Transcript_12430/g.26803 Transcript_12430/m.26803 type:complete len:116 (+) Transcript_12430:197-544(+)
MKPIDVQCSKWTAINESLQFRLADIAAKRIALSIRASFFSTIIAAKCPAKRLANRHGAVFVDALRVSIHKRAAPSGRPSANPSGQPSTMPSKSPSIGAAPSDRPTGFSVDQRRSQ